MMGFMEHEKAWNEFTKTFPDKTYSLRNTQLKALYEDLNERLASENLHEDGELSLLQAMAKEKDLMKKWRKIEKKVNHKLEVLD